MSNELKSTVESAGGLREQFEAAIAGGGLRVWAGYVNRQGGSGTRVLVPLQILPGQVDGEERDLVLCYDRSNDKSVVNEATGEVVVNGSPFRKFVLQAGDRTAKEQGFTGLVWSNGTAEGKPPLIGTDPNTRGQAIHPANPRYDELAATDRWAPFGDAPVAAHKVVIAKPLFS